MRNARPVDVVKTLQRLARRQGPSGVTFGGGGAEGDPGRDAGLAYTFDTSTSMTDPGSGDIRFNNGTIASVTALAISDTDDEGNDQDGFLDTWDDSTSTVKGVLYITTADGQMIEFEVSAITDQGTWHQATVVHRSGTLPSNDEALSVVFLRTGDAGTVGPGGNSGGHAPCRAATTANITISTALNNGDTLDGVTLATGDRVLVKNQSSAAENGIYEVGASPARTTDADAAGELYGGATVTVQEGTVNADTLWIITTNGSITPGTTAHSWALLGKPTSVNSTVEDLKVIRGIVSLSGGVASIVEGVGFSVSRNATGDVTVTFTAAFSDVPAITLTADFNVASGVLAFFGGSAPTASAFRAAIVGTTFANVDGRFHFIAIGPR